MGFEKFGHLSFTSQTKVSDFVEYLEKGEVRGTQCVSCKRNFFPPRADCAWCLTSEMEWIAVEGEGKLISFTKANYAPTGFEGDTPYILALAEFNGVRVFGRLSNEASEEDTKVGMVVKVEPIKLLNGQLSYEFRPA